MSVNIGNSAFDSNVNLHIHPYLLLENQVMNECKLEKENVKLKLIAQAKDLASRTKYNPQEAKSTANKMIDETFHAIVEQMKENTTDPTKKELITNTWHILSGELYSPLRFRRALEKALMGEA